MQHCHVSHNVPPPHPSRGVGGEPSTKFLKKGGLTGPQFLEGVAGIELSDFFQGGKVVIFR